MGRIFAFIFFLLVWLPSFVFAQPYIEGEKPVINGRTGIQVVNTGTGEIRLVTSADTTAKGFYIDSSTGNWTGVGGAGISSAGDLTLSTANARLGINSLVTGVGINVNGNYAGDTLRLTDSTNGSSIGLIAATVNGRLYNSGGGLFLQTTSNHPIGIFTNNLQRWAFDISGNLAQSATNGGDIVGGLSAFNIRQSTADASDNRSLTIAGGGSAASIRGGFLNLGGNEQGTLLGGIELYTGDAIGNWNVGTRGNGVLQFFQNNLLKWSLETNGALTSNATNGGSIVLARTGTTIAVDSGTAATACSGQVTANGATGVTTNTTCALTTSRIFLSKQSASTAVNGSCSVTAIVNATSFTITCLATDTGAYNFWITQEG